MKFSGLQKTSLVDFPNRVSSVLFTPGCNLRCPYCHNWKIVVDPKPPFLNEERALGILEARKRYVNAVVVTGGEPTLHKELPRFMKKLKDRSFVTKLDTNGFFPDVLKECLPYLDYVALDIKTSLGKYLRLGAKETTSLLRTVEMLKRGETEYEFRTTVVPGFVDSGDIDEMTDLVRGAKRFALQQFIHDDPLDQKLRELEPYSSEAFAEYAARMRNCAENIVVRD